MPGFTGESTDFWKCILIANIRKENEDQLWYLYKIIFHIACFWQTLLQVLLVF